ncbi:hypothetical protein TSMEX_006599 [Taenia solium]|eukprot:TsM_000218600 transcript=TsM_000218600 gene=TsM_000218600
MYPVQYLSPAILMQQSGKLICLTILTQSRYLYRPLVTTIHYTNLCQLALYQDPLPMVMCSSYVSIHFNCWHYSTLS